MKPSVAFSSRIKKPRISSKLFVTARLHEFWSSQELCTYVAALFKTTYFTPVLKTVAVRIGMKTHQQFLKHLSESIRNDQGNEAIEFSVEDMSAGG